MSSAIQTSPSAPPAGGGPSPPAPAPRPRARGALREALRPVASLRLTVALFALSMVLVFFGTLAQMDAGVWSVVNGYFRSFFVWIPFQLMVQFGQVFFGLPRDMQVPGAFPFPGGWLLGAALLVNLTAAHLVRFRVSWKRSGILVLHAGLIVLLLGELVTGLFAVEGSMVIEEGGWSNYVQHTRFAELAVVDSSDPKEDSVVVVPASMLQPGARVSNDLLPFDVEVERYMPNSALRDRAPDDKLPDDLKGAGRSQTAVERGEVAGTSTKQTVEYPSAYVRFVDKGGGKSLGSYLMSAWLDPQPVTVGGKTYRVALRFKRSYKPYSLYLYEFRFDRYPGTEIPKNFSSRVRLVDPERGEDREVLIRMNEPLRHRGETFYQQSFDEKTEKATILQVVRNPGWLMPYLSCALVSLGMLAHFGITLVGFLQRRVAP